MSRQKVRRNIVEIEESRCTGCGECILFCAENAIAIIDGKAKIIADSLCDGFGACMQGCPQGAMRIIERDAYAFDPEAVKALQKTKYEYDTNLNDENGHDIACRDNSVENCCCSSAVEMFETSKYISSLRDFDATQSVETQTFHWPVKLSLTPHTSPFLNNAKLLIVADCAPVVCKEFHELAKGYTVLIACSKYENSYNLIKKVLSILLGNTITSIDVLRMEVPCCQGLVGIVKSAIEKYKEQITDAKEIACEFRVLKSTGQELKVNF